MLPLKVTVSGNPGVSIRVWREVRREAFTEMGERWHERHLPNHFRQNARHKYGHQPRSASHRKRKLREARQGKVMLGGRVDNVYTGHLMRQMMKFATIRSFQTRATVTMVGPRYISMRPKPGSKQPHKAKEITTITRDEADDLTRFLDRAITKKLNAASRRPTYKTSRQRRDSHGRFA